MRNRCTTVEDYLWIRNNALLTTLTGLDGITTVGGDLKIYNNAQLTDLAGLDSITTVGGNVQIYDNAPLTPIEKQKLLAQLAMIEAKKKQQVLAHAIQALQPAAAPKAPAFLGTHPA